MQFVSMKIRRLKSTLASLGLLVVITLAGVAVSLAQDSPSSSRGYSFGLHRSLTASILGGDALCVGLVLNSGDVTISYPRFSEAPTVFHLASEIPNLSAVFAGPKSRKIALHLLDSILLI
jgi:hypothetical protein